MPEFNLDDGVSEYIEFSIFGIKYRLKHLTTEEFEEYQKEEKGLSKDSYLYKFVSKVDESSPDFSQTAKKMTVPHWLNFKKMLDSIYSV